MIHISHCPLFLSHLFSERVPFIFIWNNYNAAKLEFFSLKKMGLRENVEEIEWTKDALRIIDEIYS